MNLYQDAEKIKRTERAQNGVYSRTDLQNLLAPRNSSDFYRRIDSLQKERLITRFTRDYYLTPEGSLEALSQRICPDSYLSLGTALAKHLMIGSIPRYQLTAIKLGKTRVYESDGVKIMHLGVSPKYYFGFEKTKGIRVASPEKAWLDTLYFYQKGRKYFFDIYSDVRIDDLDFKKVKKMLKKYENPRFQKFVEGILDAHR